MERFSIREKCKVNRNLEAEGFVGIRCEKGEFSVHFPLGYRVSEDEKELRKDILLLLNTIRLTTARRDSEIQEGNSLSHETAFPVQAYLAVVADFYSRGYYKEREVDFHVAKRGKIDWNRTIKTQKAYIQGENACYLDFVTRKNPVNREELITRIHEFCVYESFAKIGWLFTGSLPERPKIRYNAKLFRSVLKDKIAGTFNDRNKMLFLHMLAIVNFYGSDSSRQSYRYGTTCFEYVWEAMADRVYGIREKKKYFPKAYWSTGGKEYEKAALRPDTIMLWKGNVYVLDSKYYKFGVTGKVSDLPDSVSVHKQITYGEYIAEREKFRELHGEDYIVYNAFLMPFDFMDMISRNPE